MVLVVCAGLVAGSLAYAQKTAPAVGWVQDASTATIPNRPAAGQLTGTPFVVKQATLSNVGAVTSGQDVLYERYQLELNGDDKLIPDLFATVTVAVKQGQQVDGRTFRRVYFTDASIFERMAKQPAVRKGVPEVQGFRMKNQILNDNTDTLDDHDTILLQFGKRRGNVLSGKIYMCMSDPKQSFVAGTFEATIK
jgi:hypothetical protein